MFAVTLALLSRGGGNNNHISYDEFVKEFLLKGNVKEIILTEKGRIYVVLECDHDIQISKEVMERRIQQRRRINRFTTVSMFLILVTL